MHQNSAFGRVRSIGKAFLFCFVFIVILIGLSFFKSLIPGRFERFAHGIAGTVAALITTYIFLRVDKRTFADIGLRFERTTLLKFIGGFLVGIVITTVMLLSMVYIGGLKLVFNEAFTIGSFLLWTSALIPLAFMEEVAFRGYPLELLKRNTGIRATLLITAVLFAIYHIANGWPVGASFLGPGIWGLIFGLAAIYSNGIAMPTGLHYAANLTQSAFGMGKGFIAIWSLETTDHTSGNLNLIGLLVQLALLVAVVVCIEWYIRQKAFRKA